MIAPALLTVLAALAPMQAPTEPATITITLVRWPFT